MAHVLPSRVGARAERNFYLVMALLMAAGVLGGFSSTWFLRPLLAGPATPPLSGWAIIHGTVMTTWLAIFVTQVSLISANRRLWHMTLGVTGIFFAALIVATGLPTGISAAVAGRNPPPFAGDQFLAIPVFSLLGPLILIPLGLANRRRDPQAHKRFMMLSMTPMIGAGFGRLTFLPFDLVTFAVPSAFVAALAVWDIHSRGALHRATIAGGAIALAAINIPPLIWETQAWLGVAHGLMNWWTG